MKRYLTINNLLVFVSLVALAFCIFFGFLESYWAMVFSFFAFMGLLFFGNLDRISRFKVNQSGFEAETREVVKEAKSTIKELQNLSKITASITLGLVKRAGRFAAGYSYDEKENIKESVLDILKQVGVDSEECEKILIGSKWYKYTELDYVHHILGGNAIPKALSEQQISIWNELRHRDLDNIATPEELMQFFEQTELLNVEVKELIEDYRYYIRNRRQRRPDIWNKRESWSHLEDKRKL